MNNDKTLGRSGLQESPQAPVGLSTANSPRWELPVVSSAVRQIQRTFRPACRDAGRASFSDLIGRCREYLPETPR